MNNRSANLIESWVKETDKLFDKVYSDIEIDKNEKLSQKRTFNSKIVQSTLLREFLGDADFTARNGGVVFSKDNKQLRYAPNYDYGECFNSLVQSRINGMSTDINDYTGEERKNLEDILKYVPNYLETKAQQQQVPIGDLAHKYASDTSEENLEYIGKHFPVEAEAFLQNLYSLRDNDISALVNCYTNVAKENSDDVELLSPARAEFFREYLTKRKDFMFANLLEFTKDYRSDNAPTI